MKFCTKCGAQLMDEAVVCPRCGCMVQDAQIAIPNNPQMPYQNPNNNRYERNPSAVLMVFGFLFSLMAMLALFFVVCSIGDAYVHSYWSLSKGGDAYISSYFVLSSDFLDVGIAFSVFAFIFGLLSFIMTLVERQRGERLFSGILKIIGGIVLLLGVTALQIM